MKSQLKERRLVRIVNIYESQEFFERVIRQWMQFQVVTEKWATSFGLTSNSFWVLYNLYWSRAGMKQVELVKQTLLSKQTISYLANHLIGRDLVQYSRDGKSRFILVLTGKGKKLMDQILFEIQQVGIYSMSDFTMEESEELDARMRKFLNRTMEGFLRGAAQRNKPDAFLTQLQEATTENS